LRSPRDGRVLIHELSLSISSGCNLFITGPNKTAKVALFRATAGIWQWGDGRISRPEPKNLFFLPERPYLPPGTLREMLVRVASDGPVSDGEILETLRLLEVDVVATRAGGLDVERDWANILGLGEQQLLAVARLVLAHPRFALLDHIATALSFEQLERVLNLFSERSITYVMVGEEDVPVQPLRRRARSRERWELDAQAHRRRQSRARGERQSVSRTTCPRAARAHARLPVKSWRQQRLRPSVPAHARSSCR
jgi:putative ATP-binding cassette transporter